MEIIDRATAKKKGLKRFFTDDPCKHGHVGERYVSSGTCVECVLKRGSQWYKDNPELVKQYAKKHYENNLEMVKENNKNWYENNQEKSKENTNKWREKNPEQTKKFAKKSYYKQKQAKLDGEGK